MAIREQHPGAPIVAHPECERAVRMLADVVCSTEKMVHYCRDSEADAFIIDLEQQAAWRKDGDARVATLRAQTEKDNLGKELLTDRYRVEFWESMATKVRARVRVSPYPLTLTSNPNPNL